MIARPWKPWKVFSEDLEDLGKLWRSSLYKPWKFKAWSELFCRRVHDKEVNACHCLCVTGQLDVVNTCANDGASPLFLAAQEGHVDCTRLLFEHGADANLATNDPVALPLHAALQFNHIEWVQPVTASFYLDLLANLHTCHCEGCTFFINLLLMMRIRSHYLQCVDRDAVWKYAHFCGQ